MKTDFSPKSPTARTPSGVLKLYCTPLTPSYSDSMIFKTEAARESWHAEQYAATASAVTFKNMRPFRAGQEIIVNGDYEKIQKNNYFAYSGDTMIWYGFINGVTYVSENACKIAYTVDVIQTFMFDAIIDENGKSKVPECFVERETVASDKYFEHIIEEGIGTQTQVVKNRINAFSALNKTEVDGLSETDPKKAKLYLILNKGGLPTDTTGTGLWYNINAAQTEGNAYNFNALWLATVMGKNIYLALHQLKLQNYDFNNIISVYPIPSDFIIKHDEHEYKIKDPTTASNLTIEIPERFDLTYIPKNKKLYTNEFCKVKVLNTANGNSEINTNKLLHGDASRSKTLYCYLNPYLSGGIIISSTNIASWANQTTALTSPELLIFSQTIPSIDVISDTYSEWRRTRQESLNASLTASAVSNGLGVLSAAASGNIGNALSSGLSFATTYQNAQIEQNIAQSSADNLIASSSSITDIYNLSLPVFIITQPALDEVKKIDSYFNTYGYKINEIKTPALFNRKKWDYIKTSNCHTAGTCSHLYLDKINQIFNAGIRLHHDSFNTITDCTITNAIA